MAKDNMGNTLKIDDLIVIKPGDMAVLKVLKISEGGLLLSGKPVSAENPGMMMAGQVTCTGEFTLNVDPRTGFIIGGCLKLAEKDKIKES